MEEQMPYFIKTNRGKPIPAETIRDVYKVKSFLGRDGVFDYEIITPDGTIIDEEQLHNAWETEQEQKNPAFFVKKH
jgi:hypothetical protein